MLFVDVENVNDGALSFNTSWDPEEDDDNWEDANNDWEDEDDEDFEDEDFEDRAGDLDDLHEIQVDDDWDKLDPDDDDHFPEEDE